MDEISRTFIDGNGFGGMNGAGLGAGFIGGLVLGSIWNGGGFGGWGNRGAVAGDVGYNSGMLTGIQQQLTDLNNNQTTQAVNNANRDLLLQNCNQTQYLGQAINSVENAVQGNTLAQCQNSANLNQGMNNGFDKLNTAILSQGYQNQLSVVQQNGENRLQAQQLANQQQQCCCQVIKTITDEACKNRELQRQIQYENKVDELAQARAMIASMSAQNQIGQQLNTLANQFAQSQATQTQAIINALKPTTATVSGS